MSHMLRLFLISLLTITLSKSQSQNLGENLLTWQLLDNVYTRNEVYITDDSGQHILIDGAAPHQITVKITNKLLKAPRITMSCTVNNLNDIYYIKEAKFCRKYNNRVECQLINEKSSISFSDGIDFGVSFIPQRGANISTDWSNIFSSTSKRADVSGFYWCDFLNDLNSLLSTTMEVQDILIAYREVIQPTSRKLQIISLKAITNDILPLTLDCPGAIVAPFQLGLQQSIPPLIRWTFCVFGPGQIVKGLQCQKQVVEDQSNALEGIFTTYFIHDNGSLTVLSISEQLKSETRALICYDFWDRTRYYGIYGAKDGSVGDEVKMLYIDGTQPYQGNLVALGPTNSSIEIRQGKRTADFILTALFRANLKKIRVQWSFNNYPLNARDANSWCQLNLGQGISTALNGDYRLRVYQDGITIDFVFHLKVIHPPILAEQTPLRSMVYVMESGSLTTQFAMTKWDLLSISINGGSLTLDDSDILIEKWQNRLMKKLGLQNLQFTISPLPPKSNEPIVYKVLKAPLGTDHIISLLAENQFGRLTINQQVTVIPLPIFKSVPSEFNYTQYDSNETLIFRCELDPDNKKRIENTGAKIIFTWYFNHIAIFPHNKKTLKILEYFNVNDTDHSLVLNSLPEEFLIIGNPDSIQNGLLECVVEIFDPVTYNPFRVNIDPLYSSRLTNDKQNLTIIINLNQQQKLVFVEAAGLSWIWGVIIALLVVFLVVFLLIYVLLKKHHGATYLVDVEERATGNDPEKEIKEQEAFRTYERDDEYDGMKPEGSWESLADTSAGIHSDSEHDGEIYGLDPSKFNEDGSFIFKYGGQNARRSKPKNAQLAVFGHQQPKE